MAGSTPQTRALTEYAGHSSGPPNTQGMATGPPYGVAHYRGVQNNNALYNAIRAHEATIRGTRVKNTEDPNPKARKERMPIGTNAPNPATKTGGL